MVTMIFLFYFFKLLFSSAAPGTLIPLFASVGYSSCVFGDWYVSNCCYVLFNYSSFGFPFFSLLFQVQYDNSYF